MSQRMANPKNACAGGNPKCSRVNSKGTKRVVSVNICSVEGNSAGIFVSKLSTGIFVIKVK